MKTIKGFVLRPLGNEFILVGESVSLVNFNKMITMNETAAFLWQKVDGLDGFTAADLQHFLLDEYEVSAEQALKDAEDTMAKWLESGIVAE